MAGSLSADALAPPGHCSLSLPTGCPLPPFAGPRPHEHSRAHPVTAWDGIPSTISQSHLSALRRGKPRTPPEPRLKSTAPPSSRPAPAPGTLLMNSRSTSGLNAMRAVTSCCPTLLAQSAGVVGSYKCGPVLQILIPWAWDPVPSVTFWTVQMPTAAGIGPLQKTCLAWARVLAGSTDDAADTRSAAGGSVRNGCVPARGAQLGPAIAPLGLPRKD